VFVGQTGIATMYSQIEYSQTERQQKAIHTCQSGTKNATAAHTRCAEGQECIHAGGQAQGSKQQVFDLACHRLWMRLAYQGSRAHPDAANTPCVMHRAHLHICPQHK
jgi:hypothetical protein